MAIVTLHKLDKVILPSSVEFGIIRNARWVAGIQSLIERPAGHPHPMFRANQAQKPMVEFSTTQLDVLLAAIGVGGAAIGQVDTFFKKATTTGSDTRASLTHTRIRIASSCGYWTSIRLPHNGVGEASVVLAAVYDGVNDPFVRTGSVALSGNLPAGTFFGAGPVKINGVAVPGVQEITVDSGVRLIQAGGESEEFDTFVGIEVTEPKVTIRTFEMTNWGTLGLRGTALNGATGLAFYARKYAALGSRVPNATAEHILFTGLLGSAIPQDTSGDASNPISDTIVCELVSGSDSVVPLIGNVASAIT